MPTSPSSTPTTSPRSLVIVNYGASWGGNEKWLATLAGRLIERGHRVVVATRPDGPVGEELARRGIPVTPVRPGGYGDVVRGLRFGAWLRRRRPDAVLVTSRKGALWGTLAARRAGVRRIAARAGIAETPRGFRHQLPFRRWIDAVIVNSRFIADIWHRDAPWFPPERVHVVLNGIQRPPALAATERQRVRAALCADPGAVLVAGAGHVARRKGFDLLLRAVAALDQPEVRAVIVGSGPQETELRALAAELGIADRVVWTGHRSDVPAIVAACDVFVLSSRNEGMANVMLEAMAVGTPVVAADISGVSEALAATADTPAAGWIVPPEDADAIRDALAEILRLRQADPDAI
ncbi:MAG TPA: glycosyltransferase, partial [Longimicrobiaceae bacterium]|nr:glycosyltransferase [Longimicrobiaceae bacterium]